jgi:DNA-binding transcriptional regulator YdaS (Cro superfamily)
MMTDHPTFRPDDDLATRARKAIAHAGGGAALAREVGVSRFAVQQWKASGIPALRLSDVSLATGIPAAELRPDLATVFAPRPTPSQLDAEEMARDAAEVLAERAAP